MCLTLAFSLLAGIVRSVKLDPVQTSHVYLEPHFAAKD